MRSRARGQTLVLFALTLLLMVVMVCITLSIATRAKRKLELQTLAETAAYSNAVATARTYNTASLLNRAMISHWVAMAGVHGLSAWASETMGYFGGLAEVVREFEAGNPAVLGRQACRTDNLNPAGKPRWYDCPDYYDPPGPGACTQSTLAIRDASYELWHAALALWRPPGSPQAGDNVNSNCKSGSCSSYRPWMRVGWGELDERVGQQAKDIHRAIAGLGYIQAEAYDQLEGVLQDQTLTHQLVNLAHGRPPRPRRLPNGYRIEGARSGTQIAWREAGLDGASFERGSTHDRVMAEAVLGARGKEFLVWYRELPRRIRRELQVIQRNLDVNWPGTFRFSVRPGIVNTYPAKSAGDLTFPITPWEEGVHDKLGFGSMVGIAKDPLEDARGNGLQLLAHFRPPSGCSSPRPQTNYRAHISWLQSNHDVGSSHHGAHGLETAAHARHPMMREGVDPGDFRDGLTLTTCHDFHVHYDERNDADVHPLTELDARIRRRDSILPGLGFIFPQRASDDGANGAWGQPKLPVMLVREEPAQKDPWDLMVNFRMGTVGDDHTLKLGERAKLDEMTALATGMAYYHRRGAWREGPNMLNPFWRANLVPLAIDERKSGSAWNEDPTRFGNRDDVPAMLQAAGHRQQARAYRDVERHFRAFKGWGNE